MPLSTALINSSYHAFSIDHCLRLGTLEGFDDDILKICSPYLLEWQLFEESNKTTTDLLTAYSKKFHGYIVREPSLKNS